MTIVVDALLSRLDREAEAERRLLASAAIINASIRIVRESAPGNETHLEYWAEQTKANMAFLNHAPLPDDGPYTDKLAEAERLLKVAREAAIKALEAAVLLSQVSRSSSITVKESDRLDAAVEKMRWVSRALAEIAPAAPEGPS